MPRAARVVAVGVPHDITQRGNNQQNVFLLDEDRRQYLKALSEDCTRYRMRLLGWCLMTNHVHLVAVAELEDAFARGLQRCHSRWAQRTFVARSVLLLRSRSGPRADGAGLCRSESRAGRYGRGCIGLSVVQCAGTRGGPGRERVAGHGSVARGPGSRAVGGDAWATAAGGGLPRGSRGDLFGVTAWQ